MQFLNKQNITLHVHTLLCTLFGRDFFCGSCMSNNLFIVISTNEIIRLLPVYLHAAAEETNTWVN